MSARAGNWELVNQDGDPLPGDEVEVDQQAGSYRTTANTINEQITALRNLSNGEARGEYADGLTKAAGDIADELSKVHNRFDAVATALTSWSPTLSEGRTTTMSLLHQAEAAHQTATANADPTTPLPDDASEADKTADTQRSQRLSSATNELAGVVRKFNHELSTVRSAADAVSKKIKDASNDDVKDSWWDSHVRKWVAEHAHLIEIIVKVLEIAAIVVAVVALVVLTGGAGLAALGIAAETLATIATVAEVTGAVLSAALLLTHAAEMNAGVNGVGWGTIALDVLSLATFGAGRSLSALGKGAEALPGVAKGAASAEAEVGLAQNVKNALNIVSDTNPLKIWAASERTTAVTSAVSRIDRVLASPAGIGTKILAGDSELAQSLASLRAMENLPSVANNAAHFAKLARISIAVNVIDHVHLGNDVYRFIHELGNEEEG